MDWDSVYFNQPIPGSVDPSNGFVWGTPEWTAARKKSDDALYAANLPPPGEMLIQGIVDPGPGTPITQQQANAGSNYPVNVVGQPANLGTPGSTTTGGGAPTTPQYVSPLPTYNMSQTNALTSTNPTAYSFQQQQNQVNPFLNPSLFGGAGTQQNQYTSPLGFYGPAGGAGFYQ